MSATKSRQVRLALGVFLLLGAGFLRAETDEVIFFTQASESKISTDFREIYLPALERTARDLEVAVEVRDIAEGAPPEVTLTPLIVYQNSRGRSIFQGRYTDPEKLAHFLRTSRVIPPASESYTRHNMAVYEDGRSRVAFPIKITPLAGDPPPGHDEESLRQRAQAAAFDGFELFTIRSTVELGPTSRLFYLDFYPYRSSSGVISVTVQLFSQFHCIEPVISRLGEPVQGPWEEFERVFGKAARLLENEVLQQIHGSEIGDGFDPVPKSVAVRSWEAMDLALPRAAENQEARRATTVDLPRRWVIEEAASGRPRVLFRFPSPLERYSGEVTEIRGELVLSEERALRGARGWAEVPTSSVTMGESSLDKAIHEKMLYVSKFPASRFDIREIGGGAEPLTFGKTAAVIARGEFQMLAWTVPIEVRGQIEPVIGEDGAPRLKVNASYRIRLQEPFKIEGPDGPEDARDTLIFHLDFLMKEG